MPVHLIADLVSSRIPSEYYLALGASLFAVSFLKTWAAGPRLLELSTDLSPLHGRVFLIATGGFTPLGLVLLSALAQLGAQLVVLTPELASDEVQQFIDLLRASAKSELIWAEECHLAHPPAVSAFVAKWNDSPVPRRLDGLVLLPDHQVDLTHRFHALNELLPILLTQPPSRDIRILSAISPWYAAAPTDPHARPADPLRRDAAAALRWLALTTEAQRRIDLLAQADHRPRSPATRSNVSIVNVCPGFQRETHLLLPHWPALLRLLTLTLVYPLLWLLTKSPATAANALVWGLTKPIDHNPAAFPPPPKHEKDKRKWALTRPIKPALLYRDAKIVRPALPDPQLVWKQEEANIKARLEQK